MKALVVNCSAPHYNLGASKLADWLVASGHVVERAQGDPGLFAGEPDLVCLSVIFSWHAPLARDIAMRFADREVWCGGPGMSALGNWWRTETGRDCVVGLDQRFDRHRGNYTMTFAARGCPVGCWFCIVPKIEGKTFTLDWGFQPAPVLCDNNLSALPDDFQDHIIARYAETGVVLKDCNSGFEPRAFTTATYHRWAGKFRGPWRFAYDETKESGDVKQMMDILRDLKPRKKQAWVLIGNEPIAECHRRAQEIIAWGGEPFCQFVLPLNWLGDPYTLRPRYDWTYQRGRDFCRYYNTHGWRSFPIEAYKPRVHEPPPFAAMSPTTEQNDSREKGEGE